jgi:hypothetical protein
MHDGRLDACVLKLPESSIPPHYLFRSRVTESTL